MSSILETEYWSTTADESLPLSLTLAPVGPAKLWVRSNRDDSKRSALGYFEGPIPPKPVTDVIAAVDAADFAGHANPPSVVPGEVVRKITVKKPTGPAVVKFVGEDAPASAGFAKAEASFLRAIEESIKFPVAAVGFHADALPDQVVSGQDIRFDLIITNPGRQTLRLTVPEAWSEAGTEFTGKGIRTDIPLAQLKDFHAPSAAIGPGNIGPAAPTSPNGKVLLAPGKSLRIPVQLRLAWEPAPYDFQLTFESTLEDAQGKALTRYEWVSPKSRLEVKKP